MSRLSSPSVLVLATAVFAGAAPLAADEGTAKILAPWEANGQLFQIAVDKLQFIGTFEGIMYIEHGEGLLDAALFTCPSTQVIHILTNDLEGHGYCTIESPAGDYVYAEFSCNGEPGTCTGQFVLTGGTGKLTGISGESQFIVRTALSGTAIGDAGGTVSAAKGLAIWPEMRFRLPGKNTLSGLLGSGSSVARPSDTAPATGPADNPAEPADSPESVPPEPATLTPAPEAPS